MPFGDRIHGFMTRGLGCDDPVSDDRKAAGLLFEQALKLDPYSSNSLVQVGLRDKDADDPIVRERAIGLLERAFGANVPKPVPIDSMQGWQLATWIFQHRWRQDYYPRARSFLVSAIGARDFPHVQAVVVLTALVFVTINLLIDVAYRLIDPRIGERDA